MCLVQALRRARGQRAGHEPAVNIVLRLLALKMLNRKGWKWGIIDQILSPQWQDKICL